jgi:hypothetical protein
MKRYDHCKLIRAIVRDFSASFAPGAVLAYGGPKRSYSDTPLLAKLGVSVDAHRNMPDVVLYHPERNRLFLIESTTGHGPIDGRRRAELARLFANVTAHLLYITAFPSRATMGRSLDEIAWETEVWAADAPSHLIHFDGGRLLGPCTSRALSSRPTKPSTAHTPPG